MQKFAVLTIVVGVVLAKGRPRNAIAPTNHINNGEPSPSEDSSHGSCGGCTFPWLDWNNDTHYGCTDFDEDDPGLYW